MTEPPAPHTLLDDGYPPDPCDLLVIGCGNILRGDDAVGPVLIRHLFERGVPDGVRLVDGGTSGMDVAFGMRGAARVIIVDASATGAEPGTVYRVPAEQLADLPPLDGLHSHNFRWDHALSFSSWLLGPDRPTDVEVFLVEVASTEPGAPLTPAVDAGMRRVADLVEAEYPAEQASEPAGSGPRVEITESGYLHVPAVLASSYFPSDVLVARLEGDTLVLVPLVGPGHGGLVLKQRNAAGDRSLLVSEVLGFRAVGGIFDGTWDAERGALLVRLEGSADEPRGDDRGGAGVGALGGLPDGADAGRRGPHPGATALHRGEGAQGGGDDRSDGFTPTTPPGGTR
ncbi:MAG: hydrogenase maturation protease [Nocardioidaceae bacterium]